MKNHLFNAISLGKTPVNMIGSMQCIQIAKHFSATISNGSFWNNNEGATNQNSNSMRIK